MSDLTMIDFQIFPSQYEQNSDGEKCCWLGGKANINDQTVSVTLQPYQTSAISGHSDPEWGFHLLSAGKPDLYRLKYVKMSDPLGYWYGVSVDDGKIILKKDTEDTHFIVKKLGAYYTIEYAGKHVECEDGYLGQSTDIQLWATTPPSQLQINNYDTIPSNKFRVLWKFVKMDHISGPDWMARLAKTSRKSLTIDRLFIPGAHDSGTEENTQWYQTQFQTIKEQVAMGVRYFDLRVADNWDIYHGMSSDIKLEYVLNSVLDHLKSNSDEFFILQITPETAANFSTRLHAYLTSKTSSVFNHVYMGQDIPTLDQSKGKIFFFARMYTPVVQSNFREHSIDWTDNTGGSTATKKPFTSPNVYVQDAYKMYTDSTKFNDYIKPTLINYMFPGNNADWIINFTSVANANYPIHAAEDINPWVANLLMWTKPFPTGVLMIDDARVGNVANIIALNFD
ncbi:phosphatidylinositol-specific phospholipase C domain-containing protein [Flavobacterium amniphilum]|uniref:phosphatidylinositol-specific phospholipase C domain-containing protein n=1 Tax=Flavobacterium amniphilum TaxID=1834035 RepID=UPI002029E923|nr:phosphatidylinositol-specific phospholipase C domain-containing protein [Flavobacterium amniphilum]MCL9807120.1 phosphatidylinositol-specific phospholipase C domain-containing protein [Flavobacterium amniphilum]